LSPDTYYEIEARGFLTRLKARLMAKRYSHTYGVDYQEKFSPVTK